MILIVPAAVCYFVSVAAWRLYVLIYVEALPLTAVESRVEDIRRELMLMNAFLKDIDSRGEAKEEGYYEWVNDLHEVTRKAEDLIETFLDISVGRKSWIFSLVDRYKVGKEVERIIGKMIRLSERKVNYDQSHQTNISREVESLPQTSHNATEDPAVEKLSYILSENLVASLEVKRMVEEVKDEVVSMLKVMSNLKSKEQSSEREKVWMEEANTVCNFTVSVVEDFTTRRRQWVWIDMIIRFLTFSHQLLPSEKKLMKEMKYIKFQVQDALFRRLTYGVGEEDVGYKIGFTYGGVKKYPIVSLTVLVFLMLVPLVFGLSLLLSIGTLISISVISVHRVVHGIKHMDKKLEPIRRDLAVMHAFFRDIIGVEGLNERQKVWVEQIRDTAQQAEAVLAAYDRRLNPFKGDFRIILYHAIQILCFNKDINYVLCKIHNKWEMKTLYDIAIIEGRGGLVSLGQNIQGSGSELYIVVEHNDNTEEDPLLPAGMSNNYQPRAVDLLQEDLQLMKALFSDANEMGELDGRSKIWVEQMKDIAREIESFINDDRAIKGALERIFALSDIFKKRDRIRIRIEEASRIRKQYDIHLQTRAESSSVVQRLPLNLKEFDTINTNLPLYLMRCLSYFVLFPPEFEIPTRRLIVLWVAEGLVRQEQDQEPAEQVAKRYLTELIELKMVEVTTKKHNGKMKTCRLSNVLRESPFLQARLRFNSDSVSNESITHQGAGHSSTNSDSAQKKPIIRQVADRVNKNDICYNHIHSDTITASASLKSLYKDVLSFLSFDDREGGKPGREIGKFLNRCISSGCFLHMRVLDLERVYKPQLPEDIATLSQLRYLGLRWTYLESLPSSISRLLKLQTLDLKHTYISILPSSIWKLQLRHLFLSETYRTRFPPSFIWKMELRQLFLSETYRSIFLSHPKGNSLSDLQTLWGLFVDEKTPVKGGLDRLVNIRKLGLACQSMSLDEEEMTQQLHAVAEWIMNLKYLQSLRLKSRKEDGQPGDLHLVSLEKQAVLADMYLSGILKSPPMKSLFPPSLIELTLSHSNLQQDSIEILGELPLLQSLCLLAGSYIEETLHCKRGSFPRLLALKVWKLKELREWNIEEAAFPLLEHLEIRSCECLQMLPDGLEHISTLCELKLTTMSEKFIERVDKHKIPFSCMVFRYCIIPVSSNLLE